MLATSRIERPKSETQSLAQVVKDYLTVIRNPQTDLSYEARLALRRHHLDKLQAAVDREERGGSTLVEVLVALLIFSIGMMGVLSLFPVSIERGVKAAKMTRATDLRYNAEAAVDQFPFIVSNPDLARDAAGNLNPDAHAGERFVFDPLGLAINPALGNTFGDLKRYAGTWQTAADADSLVTSPDSWDLQFEAFGTKATATQVDVPGLGASKFGLQPGVNCRALVMNVAANASQVRTPTSITGDTVAWTAPLPAGFVPGKVRIELQERRYTWLLTVRREDTIPVVTIDPATGQRRLQQDPSGLVLPSVDVVVFFNRTFDPADEAVFPTPGPAPGSSPAGFTAWNSQVTVNGLPSNAKKGSFVFDGNGGYWYRISTVQPNTPAAGQTTVWLETPAVKSSPAGGGVAMFPRGVVDVFPIGVK